MIFELTAEQFLALTAVASKACEFEEAFATGLDDRGMFVEARQVRAILGNTRPILKQLDDDHPGFLPLPHDGVAWKDWE